MNQSRCVVSCGYGGWYARGAERLRNILARTNPEVSTMIWANKLPPESRLHNQVPYDFKPKAIQAAQKAGFTSILWLDSSVVPNADISPIFNQIEKDGYFIMINGWSTGEWCSDRVLPYLNATRDELMTYPHGIGGILGFDLSRPSVVSVFNQWNELSTDCFPGPWYNENGKASSDTRVLGHRHDQTVISVLAHRAGWTFTPPGDNKLMSYGQNEEYLLNLYPIS